MQLNTKYKYFTFQTFFVMRDGLILLVIPGPQIVVFMPVS